MGVAGLPLVHKGLITQHFTSLSAGEVCEGSSAEEEGGRFCEEDFLTSLSGYGGSSMDVFRVDFGVLLFSSSALLCAPFEGGRVWTRVSLHGGNWELNNSRFFSDLFSRLVPKTSSSSLGEDSSNLKQSLFSIRNSLR